MMTVDARRDLVLSKIAEQHTEEIERTGITSPAAYNDALVSLVRRLKAEGIKGEIALQYASAYIGNIIKLEMERERTRRDFERKP